jgi:DNA polymerase elongation subunit (family B)
LQLYRKYTYHEQPSYRLDFIGEVELGERKVQYDGTLDQLYKRDFHKFIEYNRQDVMLLNKLETKLKFIGLTNILAHENCILFNTTLGAVALTDQAVVLEAHRRGMIVPERKKDRPDYVIAGAYVAQPKTGLSEWVASVDINSLYPSTIRALNMSPETLVGQIRQELTSDRLKNNRRKANLPEEETGDEDDDEEFDKWGGLFACLEYDEVMKESDVKLTIDIENESEPLVMTAKELYDWVYNPENKLCLSANGTIFRTDINGVIPGLLEKWYADRKTMQKEMRKYEKLISESHHDEAKLKEYRLQRDYWDQRQMARKINLNALYGAITNVGSRFCDQRIGQSTTLSGRTILKHMMSQVGETLYGEYSIDTPVNLYGDTDSNYFTIKPILESLTEGGFELSKESFVELANGVADAVNDSFPGFITKAFNVAPERKDLIKCGRELCMTNGLFLKKKHYAVLYYDKDNIRQDKGDQPDGKLYIKGLATQRADTPETIQKFLKEVLHKVLTGSGEREVIEFVREFRTKVKTLHPWEKGTPKRANNVTMYESKMAVTIASFQLLMVKRLLSVSLNQITL